MAKSGDNKKRILEKNTYGYKYFIILFIMHVSRFVSAKASSAAIASYFGVFTPTIGCENL